VNLVSESHLLIAGATVRFRIALWFKFIKQQQEKPRKAMFQLVQAILFLKYDIIQDVRFNRPAKIATGCPLMTLGGHGRSPGVSIAAAAWYLIGYK
jgi:hypothetical protein